MKKTIGVFLALAVGLTAKATIVTTIQDKDDFVAFRESVNSGDDYRGITVTLNPLDGDCIDLECNEYDLWEPIGSIVFPFNGTFDGQGYTVTGLYINALARDYGYGVGLFGFIGDDGVVQDLSIENSTDQDQVNGYKSSMSDQTQTYIGAIAGFNYGRITGCFNRGVKVTGSSNYVNVGGIVGMNAGIVENCYNLGYTDLSKRCLYYNIGGIAGVNDNGGIIRNCFTRIIYWEPPLMGLDDSICAKNLGGEITACVYMIDGDDIADVILYDDGSVFDGNWDEADLSDFDDGDIYSFWLGGRTIYCDETWNTICLPFDIPEGAVGYSPIAGTEVLELESASFNQGVLTLNFSDASSIEAGKPYLLRWKKLIEEVFWDPVFMDVVINSDAHTEVTKDLGDGKSITFTGSYEVRSFDEVDNTILFLGEENTLYYPDDAMDIGPCRAFFQLTGFTAGEPDSEVNAFVLNFGDETKTTGIKNGQWSMVNPTHGTPSTAASFKASPKPEAYTSITDERWSSSDELC